MPKIIHNLDGTITVVIKRSRRAHFKTEAEALAYLQEKLGSRDAANYIVDEEINVGEGQEARVETRRVGTMSGGEFVYSTAYLQTEGETPPEPTAEPTTEPTTEPIPPPAGTTTPPPAPPTGETKVKPLYLDEAAILGLDETAIDDTLNKVRDEKGGSIFEDVLQFIQDVHDKKIKTTDEELNKLLQDNTVLLAVEAELKRRLVNIDYKTLEQRNRVREDMLKDGIEGPGLQELVFSVGSQSLRTRAHEYLLNLWMNGDISEGQYYASGQRVTNIDGMLPKHQTAAYLKFFDTTSGMVGKLIDIGMDAARAAGAHTEIHSALQPYNDSKRLTDLEQGQIVEGLRNRWGQMQVAEIIDELEGLLSGDNLEQHVDGVVDIRLEKEFNTAYDTVIIGAVQALQTGASGYKDIQLQNLVSDLEHARETQMQSFMNQYDFAMDQIEGGILSPGVTGVEGKALGPGGIFDPSFLTAANYLVRNSNSIWREVSPRSEMSAVISAEMDPIVNLNAKEFFKETVRRLTEEAYISNTLKAHIATLTAKSENSILYTDEEMAVYLEVADAVRAALVLSLKGYLEDEKNGFYGNFTGKQYLNNHLDGGLGFFDDNLPESAQALVVTGSFSRTITAIEKANTSVVERQAAIDDLANFIAQVRGGMFMAVPLGVHPTDYASDPDRYAAFSPTRYSDAELKTIFDEATPMGMTAGDLIVKKMSDEHAISEVESASETKRVKKTFDEFYEANYLNNLSQRILDEEDPDEQIRLRNLKAEILGYQSVVEEKFNEAYELAEGITPADWFAGEGNDIAQVLQGVVLGKVVPGVEELQVLIKSQATERGEALDEFDAFVARVRGGTIANVHATIYAAYFEDPHRYAAYAPMRYTDAELKKFFDEAAAGGVSLTPDKVISATMVKEQALSEEKLTGAAEQEQKAFNEYYEANYVNNLLKEINDLTAPADTDERNRLINMSIKIEEMQSGIWSMFKEASDLAEGITPENWFAGEGNDQAQVLQGAVVAKVVPGVEALQVLIGGQSIAVQAELDAELEATAAVVAEQVEIARQRRNEERFTTAAFQAGGAVPFGQDLSGQPQQIKGVDQPVETDTALQARRAFLGVAAPAVDPRFAVNESLLGLEAGTLIPGGTISAGGVGFFENTPFFQGLSQPEQQFASKQFEAKMSGSANPDSANEVAQAAAEVTAEVDKFKIEQTAIADRRALISTNLGPLPGALDDPIKGQREALIRQLDEFGEESLVRFTKEGPISAGPRPAQTKGAYFINPADSGVPGGFSESTIESIKANFKAAKQRAVEQLGPRPEGGTTPLITG